MQLGPKGKFKAGMGKAKCYSDYSHVGLAMPLIARKNLEVIQICGCTPRMFKLDEGYSAKHFL